MIICEYFISQLCVFHLNHWNARFEISELRHEAIIQMSGTNKIH